jgi:hypothetical protein
MLRGCWCDIIVLNVHFPTEDRIGDVKNSFHEELECELREGLTVNKQRSHIFHMERFNLKMLNEVEGKE